MERNTINTLDLIMIPPSVHAAFVTNLEAPVVDFLTTRHGLASALQSDKPSFDALHHYFLEHLVPVCGQLLTAARETGEIRSDVEALELMWGVGSLRLNRTQDAQINSGRLVNLLLAGLR